MSGSNNTLLSYTLTPGHLGATEQDAVLTLTATNRTGTDVSCSRITLLVPQGKGAEQLTTQHSDDITLAVEPDWQPCHGDLTHPDRLELGMEYAGGTVIPDNGEAAFRLSGLTVNGDIGTVTLTVREEGDETTRTTLLPLDKNPPGFVFRDFRPDPYMVDPDHPEAILTWTAQEPPATTVTYLLDYGAARPKEVTDTSFLFRPFKDTVCVLTATLRPEKGPTTRAALSTLVLLARPAVDAVKLTASGSVRLLNRPRTGGGPLAGHTTLDWRAHLIHGNPYTADTDGLLLATALTQGGSPTLTVRLTLTAGGTDHPLTMTAGHHPETLTLPVPAHSTVTITTFAGAEPPTDPWYLLVLDWRPLGRGHLRPSGTAQVHR
ncbi:hypothetical protein [Streptomyces sp. I05A-00742]|uniref:hypothetical protein n=1 Tax=Streptomyces sp. I05A-00742 TaxID=2732853 RepID=UPI001487AB56|nr:hypothetical protein [Streptomyces sp. I05A-00742]